MSTSDIVKVARRFSSLNPDTVDMLTLRTTAATIGGAAVLKFDRADVQADIDRLNGVAPPPAQAAPADRTSDVRVRVLNGTGGEGVAAKVGEALQGDGFNVADRGDADAFTYSRTVVRYAPGQQAKAELLQRYLQAGATLRPDPTLKTVDLTVVVGADFSGVRATPGAGATGGPATTVTTQAPPSPVPVPKGAPPQPSC